MKYKRMTLFAGHYGSGKTNIALNYALWLRRQGLAVTVADLDIVNPYFRTKDGADILARQGIGLIASPFANSNVDLPALPGEVYALVEDRSVHGVIDVGGDDRGALALGRYVPSLREENDYDMLFVVNKARPLTRNVDDALEVFREIESASGLPFTAIVNNTNLGAATTAELVMGSLDYAREIGARTGLPVKMTCAMESLIPQLQNKVSDLFPISVMQLYYMEKEGTSIGKINL
ncbi:MAG: hypothetical protein IKO22_07735 [Oscillospiraceae bacterium]|nr:hypothetical protein [Oscillospiraceae bacterium]